MSTERGVWDPTKVYVGDMMDDGNGNLIPRPAGADIVVWQGARWVANYYHSGVNPMTDRPGDTGFWKLEAGSTPNYDPAAPQAPTGLTTGFTNDDVVTLFWNAAYVPGIGDVSSYNIFADGVKVGASTSTSFQVSGLDPAHSYSFTVAAVNATGVSPLAVLEASTDAAETSNGKYYSPFIDMTLPSTNILELARDSDLRDFTLAFMQTTNDHLDANGHLISGQVPTLAWGGITNTTLPTGVIIQQIAELQKLGGNITISFGGYNGRDPAVICAEYSEDLQANQGFSKAAADAKAADHLQSLYQSVMDTYGITHLDFDVENAVFKNDEAKKYPTVDDVDANHLRNLALNGLKEDNPDLHITFTVATLPTGVSTQPSTMTNGVLSGSGDVEALLALANADGVPIDVVNIMAMDYFDGPGLNDDMGDAAISAAKAMHTLLMSLGLDAKVGITPMLGQNDAYNPATTGNEVFRLDDAQDLMDFFASTPWVAGLGAWQLPRDRAAAADSTGNPPVANGTGLAQDDFEFSSILSKIGLWRATGGRGDDVIDGTAIANTLTGNDGADALNGNGGNDTLSGGNGTDTLGGGAGNDTFVNPNGDIIVEAVNGGTDTVESNATFSLAATANVERLFLTGAGNINGTGNALANQINGNTGNNVLNGGGGIDTLNGGDGNDTLDGGGPESDQLRGGLNNDVYINPLGDIITELAGYGTDTVQSDASFSLEFIANVERLFLTGTGNVLGTGNALDNIITGNSGNNLLTGGAGLDTINGGDGNDTMIGGGPEADLLRGGAHNDVYINPLGDTIVELANQGTDTVQSDASFSLELFANVERLFLTGTGNITGTGGAGGDHINGNSGNNLIRGLGGADSLNGGDGNDTIEGGANNDTMNGGAGADRFLLGAGAGSDTINGFTTGADKFDLGGGSFSSAVVGGGGTTLTHSGGTVFVAGVNDANLGAWNAQTLRMPVSPQATQYPGLDLHDTAGLHHADYFLA